MARLILGAFCGISLAIGGAANAAPYRGETFTLRQPDGSPIPVRIWGDEFYQHVEGLDGYALACDKSGWIQFAEASAGGEELAATGIAYIGSTDDGLQDPDPSVRARFEQIVAELQRRNINRHLQESLRGRRQIHQRNLELLGLEVPPGTPPPPSVLKTRSVTGSITGLCLLVDFADDPAGIPRDAMDDFWNLVDGYTQFGNNGSLRRYYLDASGGLLDLQHDVHGYYRAAQPKWYYTDPSIPYGQRARELLAEALEWLDDQGFDFASLSTSDGLHVMSCYMMYAGSIDNNWAEGMWPHAGGIFWGADGVIIGNYACGNIGWSPIIGLEAHETGHSVCHWPDLYDYDGDSAGAGDFGIGGTWSGNPDVPPSFLRAQAGWMNVVELNGAPPGTTYEIEANLALTCLRYSRHNAPNEYFVVENVVIDAATRRAYAPDQGVLIWHVDEYGSNSWQEMTPLRHYYGSVEQADGLFELEHNLNGGGEGDLYHAGGRIRFDNETLPDSKWWDGTSSGFNMTNVGPIGFTTTVTVSGQPVAACCDWWGSCFIATEDECPAPNEWLSASWTCTPNPCLNARFIRSDVDGSGTLDISDPIYSLAYQFDGGLPPPCLDAADDDDSGEINIADPIYSLSHQFDGEAPPPPPFPDCGLDPMSDWLTCDGFAPCGGKALPSPGVTPVRDGSKRIVLEELPDAPPDTLVLRITVESDVPLAGLEGTVGLDPTRVQFIRMAKTGMGAQMSFLSACGVSDPPAVRLGCVWDLTLADALPSGSHEIGRLLFAPVGPETPLETAIWLAGGRFVGTDLSAYIIEGEPAGDPTALPMPGPSSLPGLAVVFPNPYRPRAPIDLCFEPPASDVVAAVYDVLGRRARVLFTGAAGPKVRVTWDGRTNTGAEAAAGLYYLRVKAGRFEEGRGLLLMK